MDCLGQLFGVISMTFGIDDAISAGLQIINKFVPDPAQKAEAIAEHEKLVQEMSLAQLSADVQTQAAQIDVNKIEAASEDKYTSRARPTIIYLCGFGFGYQYILQPFLLFAITCLGKTIVIPTLDMTAIGTVLLGICGLRSWDKKQF